MTENNNYRDAAIDLASKGWPIFPLVPNTKKPLRGSHGFHDAIVDLEKIDRWWSARPNDLIGCAIPDHLLVIDIDPRHLTDERQVEALDLPTTLTVWSGRGDGGRHLYFLRPPGELSGTRLPRGVDLKVGGKSYVIMPPSKHPVTGQPYRWGDVEEVAELPERVRRLLRPQRPRLILRSDDDDTGQQLVEWVAKLEWGNVNNGLHWAACRAAERGLPIFEELVRAGVAAGESESQARRTVASAYKGAMQ